jgi:serine/threonine protein kinase
VLPAGFSADPNRLRRFEQEARATAALNHPNILAVYDIGTHDAQPYIVSELLDGGTLREAIAAGALPVSKAVDYARQVALGLAAAHAKGITHRDIKPENLFVTTDGRVKILDFGLAKLRENASTGDGATRLHGSTDAGVVLGTVRYMSPEQVRGQAADHRSDIFSVGVVLFEMLTGARPFQGDSVADTMSAILKEDPPDLVTANAKISPTLDRVVRHCLEKNPGERFQSAQDLAFALQALTTGSTASAAALAGVFSSSSFRAWRERLAWTGVAVLLVVTGTLLMLRVRSPQSASPSRSVVRFALNLPTGVELYGSGA